MNEEVLRQINLKRIDTTVAAGEKTAKPPSAPAATSQKKSVAADGDGAAQTGGPSETASAINAMMAGGGLPQLKKNKNSEQFAVEKAAASQPPAPKPKSTALSAKAPEKRIEGGSNVGPSPTAALLQNIFAADGVPKLKQATKAPQPDAKAATPAPPGGGFAAAIAAKAAARKQAAPLNSPKTVPPTTAPSKEKKQDDPQAKSGTAAASSIKPPTPTKPKEEVPKELPKKEVPKEEVPKEEVPKQEVPKPVPIPKVELPVAKESRSRKEIKGEVKPLFLGVDGDSTPNRESSRERRSRSRGHSDMGSNERGKKRGKSKDRTKNDALDKCVAPALSAASTAAGVSPMLMKHGYVLLTAPEDVSRAFEDLFCPFVG